MLNNIAGKRDATIYLPAATVKLASFLDEAEHRQPRPRRPRWDRGSFPPYRWLLDPASRSAGDNFYSNWAIQCF